MFRLGRICGGRSTIGLSGNGWSSVRESNPAITLCRRAHNQSANATCRDYGREKRGRQLLFSLPRDEPVIRKLGMAKKTTGGYPYPTPPPMWSSGYLPGSTQSKRWIADDQKVELTPEQIAKIEREVLVDIARESDHPAVRHSVDQLIVLTKLSHAEQCASRIKERRESSAHAQWIAERERKFEEELASKRRYEKTMNGLLRVIKVGSIVGVVAILYVLIVSHNAITTPRPDTSSTTTPTHR